MDVAHQPEKLIPNISWVFPPEILWTIPQTFLSYTQTALLVQHPENLTYPNLTIQSGFSMSYSDGNIPRTKLGPLANQGSAELTLLIFEM